MNKITLDFAKNKRFAIIFGGLILSFITLVTLFSETMKINGIRTEVAFVTRLLIIISVWIFFPLLYYTAFHPWRVQLIKSKDNLKLIKRGLFFRTKIQNVSLSKNPVLFGKRRRMIGFNIYVGKAAYLPTIIVDNEEIELMFTTASNFIKGGHRLAALTKEELQDIARQLNIPLRFEE